MKPPPQASGPDRLPAPKLLRYPGHRHTSHEQSLVRRRSYRRVVYRRLARLPRGAIPDICCIETRRDIAVRRWKRRGSKAASAAVFLAVMMPVAFADTIYETYLAPKQELPTAAQLGGPPNVSGTETFNALATTTNSGGTSFVSTFGNNGAISGAFSGVFGILDHNQYGGANTPTPAAGASKYIVTFDGATGLHVKFSHTAAVPGVNYVGLQISALDQGNQLTLYRAGIVVGSYGPAALTKAVGACPTNNGAANPYCGNPTTGENTSEQYAYVNFFNLNNYFDELMMTETSGGGFEADNFTVGYLNPIAPFGTVLVPEPGSVAVVLSGLLGMMFLRRRRLPAQAP